MMIDRRRLLTSAAALGAVRLIGPGSAHAAGTPAPGDDDFPVLAITVTNFGYEAPAQLAPGRYRVTVTNASEGESHLSLGWIPETISDEQVARWQDDDQTNDGTPEEFFSTRFVGLPDWPKPGESRSGVVDLPEAGRYFLFDPFNGKTKLLRATGEAAATESPTADVEIVLAEMSLALPSGPLKAGPSRWRIENAGAFTHEIAILPAEAGLTNDELGAYIGWAFSIPEGATPDPATPVPGGGKIDLAIYEPVAAMSLLRPGGVSWIDVELPAGTYAAICAVPGPTDDVPPHALLGMHAVIEVV